MRQSSDVNELLDHLPRDTRPIVAHLRGVVHGISKEIAESVAWGALSFHRPWIGGRVKGAVCQIVVKHGEVRLDFIHGARLPDPHGLLRGDRLAKRFVRIATLRAARRPALAALIRAAAAYDPTIST